MNENKTSGRTPNLTTSGEKARTNRSTDVVGKSGEKENKQASSNGDPQSHTFARLYKVENVAERFVGRTDELNKLHKWFSLALTGHGKPVFIIGDPGIGKTELVRQFFSRLKDTDKIVLNGRYFDVASGAPYKVFLDGLYDLIHYIQRSLERGETSFLPFDYQRLTANLSEIQNISLTIPIQGIDGDRIKYRTFDLLAQSYRLLTPIHPVILFLDDLQWADELSLEFLAYLIRAIQGEKFFLVGTVREHDIVSGESPLRVWLRRMNRYNAYEQIKLQPLTETDLEELINATFSGNQFEETFISQLYKETDGNPYYLLEIIKQLLEDGKIFWENERWECSDISDLRVPKTLVDLTELNLSRLDEVSLSVFKHAAVIGEEFSFALLQAVTEMDDKELTASIEWGLREFLIREEPHTLSDETERYTFYYNTTRKVLYEKLSSRQRRSIHLRAAEILENAKARLGSKRNPGEVAYHYFYAGNMKSAFYWSTEAGTAASQRFNFDRAHEFFRWAQKSLEVLQQGETEAPEVLLLAKYYYGKGQLHNVQGDYEAAAELLQKAKHLARDIGDRKRECEVLMLLGNTCKQASAFSEALNAYQTALKIATEAKLLELQWPAAHCAAQCEIELGHPKEAAGLLHESILAFDNLMEHSSTVELAQMVTARTEMGELLDDLKEKLAKEQVQRSGSFMALEAQVCQEDTPKERSSRMVEIMVSPMELFKQYALWFKQLHGTNEILNKLSRSQLEPPRVVGLIFTGLKQLKGRINELDIITVNSQLALIEKQLQEFQRWLQQLNDMLPPFTMRQYLDRGMVSAEEMLQLARFLVMVKPESEDDKGKVELLLTRALELEVERYHIIAGLFPADISASPLSSDNSHMRALNQILGDIEQARSYSEFLAKNITARIKQIKAEFGQLFWHPEILTGVIETDLKLDLRFKELIEQEQKELLGICDQLLTAGIRVIPRSEQGGSLDVEVARRMAERVNDLLNTNYESNRSGLVMLAEVGRVLREYMRDYRLAPAAFENPFIDAPVPSPAPPSMRALPAAPANEKNSRPQMQAPTISPSTANLSANAVIPPVATSIKNSSPLPMSPISSGVNAANSNNISNLPAQTGMINGQAAEENRITPIPITKPVAVAVNGDGPLPSQMYLSGALPRPFIDGNDVAGTGMATRLPALDMQVEAKLQSRLAEICILLATKLRDLPVKVLQLKRSQLAIASWEVDALLSSEDDATEQSINKQNHLVRRSIALLAEMQEVGIASREMLNAGQRQEAIDAMRMAEYFLEQSKVVAAGLETHSHRERDASQSLRAQNLAATRQKLMSTHQLLNTLIGWLKREMDK